MVLRALFFIFFLSWPPASPAAALDFSIATVSATGDTGHFSSLAIDQDGSLHAAYYDADTGEVYYTSRTAGAGWSVPTKILNGDNSAHVSLAVGVDGTRHVAFYSADAPCTALCYAVSSDGSAWTPAAVDDAAAGEYASVAINGAGYPGIAYAGAGGVVRYALFDGAAWTLETADAAASVLVDLGGDESDMRQMSLALDGAGRPRIAYFDANNTVLKYAARGAAAWGAPETVENTGAVFAGVSLALDGGGEPRISYADYDNGSLRYAARAGGSWSAVEAVAALGPPQIQFSSALGLDGDGDPLIAFNDDDTPALYFAWYTGAAWNSQTVDNDADTAGYFVALAIDAAGNPHIVYGDSQSGSSALKYASATAAGFTPPLGGGPGGKVQAPADFRAQNASSAAITWSWSDNVANELGFELYGAASSTGPFTLIADTNTLGPNVTSFSESELTPNTSYFRYIAAVNAGGVAVSSGSFGLTGRMSAPGTAAAAFTAVSTANFTAHWTRGAGAADTSYIVLASTAADFSVVNASSETWNLSAVLGGLEPATTYYVRAAAFAGASTSSYTNLGSTATPPFILAAADFVAGAAQGISSIAWSWGNIVDESGFRVVSSTGGNMSGDLAADILSFTETGLSTNTLYSRRVVAFAGFSYSTSVAAAVYTLAAPPASFAFVDVFITSMSLQWAANTNPGAATAYRVDRWEAGGATTSVTAGGLSAALTGLAGGTTYYLTVSALNGDGVATASGLELSTVTWPASWSEATLGAGGGGDIAFSLPGGAASVNIPAGAFAEAVTVTVTAPASFPAAVSPTMRLQGTGVGLEITLNKPLQPTLGVLLRVPYLDSEVAGLDQSRLLLARYDVPRGVWVPLVSNADPAANMVTAVTDHFSTFQLMAAAPGDLSNLKAFPNPLRPALGHRTMKFAGLPAAALLRIYTPLGELVRELTANTAGMAEWDGTNSSGHAAASGAYYVFVKDEGRTRTFGVAVQR